MDRSSQLSTGSIPRLLIAFSLPAIVGMVAQALYGLVNRIFVGQALGAPGIAGATVAYPCMLILVGFGLLIGLGATALISLRLGEQRRAEAEQVLGNALSLLVVVFLTITALGLLFLDPLLIAFGASSEVLPYARDYMRIILLGSIFQGIGFGLNHPIRGEGNPRIAMLTMLLGAVLNMILDPIFIFGFGWGMAGAAWGTVIAQAASAAWVLRYYLGGKSLLTLRLANLRFRWPICRAILVIGSPPFAMQIAASLLNSILNNQLHLYGGDLAISVMGIIYAVAMMVFMPLFGINQGLQPIVGYNYGARRFDRVRKALLWAIGAATGVATLGFLITFFAPAAVIQLFNRKDVALQELGVHAMRLSMIFMPIVGFQVVSAHYFQGVGKPAHAMLLTLSRQILFLIPAVLFLPRFFGLDGVWMAIPAADLVTSLLTAAWLFRELRHLDERHAAAASLDVPLAESLEYFGGS